MLETISGGMFDNAIGVRPLLGQDLRFGDPDMADVSRRICRSRAIYTIRFIICFWTDQDYDDKDQIL